MAKRTKKTKSLGMYIAFALIMVISLTGLVKAYSGSSSIVVENVENFIVEAAEQVAGLMGGITNFDSLTLSDNLIVGGTITGTGNVSLSGALTTSGSANVGNLTYGLTTVASSTVTNATYISESDLTTYSGVDFTPGDLAVNAQLPASSTLTSFIVNAGECMDWRWRNLDATAATSTTFVAGAGMDLVENENGDVVIEGGNEAQLKFCRELDTDVTVYVDEYIAAD